MTQKLFMELDDDLFFNKVIKLSSKDKELKNMKLFNKLKFEYLLISNIKDYKNVQKELYGNKTRREIIEFEIVRIINNFNNDEFVATQLMAIENLLKMYGDDIPEKDYKLIINSIIKLELMLDIKIGLFVELCELFEKVSKRNMFKEEILYKENNKMEKELWLM